MMVAGVLKVPQPASVGLAQGSAGLGACPRPQAQHTLPLEPLKKQ